jgi:hypothetical protein
VTAVARSAGLFSGGSARAPRDRPLRAAGSRDPVSSGPIVVLATAYSGGGRLRYLLDRHPQLACTSGTGILPLCEQAMTAWRNAEGRPGGSPSTLAVTSTRALADSIITSVLAREGKQRWCEVATANVKAAEAFLRLYPGARMLCLYRACPDVVRAILDASPWGIADPAFAPFTRMYPASTVVGLTAYWVAHTGPLLAFEQSHPQACLRIRFEDLTTGHQETAQRLMSFIGIAGLDGQAPPAGDSQTPPASDSHEADLPADLIPPMMLAEVNDLLRQLDYPQLPATSARR